MSSFQLWNLFTVPASIWNEKTGPLWVIDSISVSIFMFVLSRLYPRFHQSWTTLIISTVATSCSASGFRMGKKNVFQSLTCICVYVCIDHCVLYTVEINCYRCLCEGWCPRVRRFIYFGIWNDWQSSQSKRCPVCVPFIWIKKIQKRPSQRK